MKKSVSILALAFAAAILGGCAAPQVLPEDGFVRVPGGRVAFKVLGAGNAIPVLMIHGGPGGVSCGFAGYMGALATARPVVIYDQLGSGNSDRMTDLARDAVLPRFVEEVTALRARLGLKQVHLVGHSWGATVALEYLLTVKPDGVKSVSLVGPLISTPMWIEDAKVLVAQLPAENQKAINDAVAAGKYDSPEFENANRVFGQNFGRRSVRPKNAPPTPCASSPVPFNKALYEHMWGPSEFLSTGTLRTYDRTSRLKELKLPTLFMVGEYDEARPATMLKFQALVPGSIVKVLPDAGHGSFVDQTKAYNATLVEFMAAAERR